MNLRRITNLRELAEFTPSLLVLHDVLEGKWEPDLNEPEFLEQLIEHFGEDAYYFGDFAPNGELIYFAAIVREDEQRAMFWLFYMNKSFREQTRSMLEMLKEFLRLERFSTVYCQSVRMSSSYERWLEKFGAKKDSIVYKFNL